METSLVSTLPLICVFAALIYAAFVGEKTYSSTGAVSILGVAITLFGLIVGWLLEMCIRDSPYADLEAKAVVECDHIVGIADDAAQLRQHRDLDLECAGRGGIDAPRHGSGECVRRIRRRGLGGLEPGGGSEEERGEDSGQPPEGRLGAW